MSKRLKEAEAGSMKGVRADGASFERGGVLLGVDLDESDEEITTGGQGTVPN